MSRKLRKLITEDVLFDCKAMQDIGVPVAKIISVKGLHCSNPHLTKLLAWLNASVNEIEYTPYQNKLIHNSLFPSWLKLNSNNMQTQPEDTEYNGSFPFGQWETFE